LNAALLAANIVSPMDPVIYCADIGSVPKGRFGWSRGEAAEGKIERHRGGTEIIDLVEAVGDDLTRGRPVALGFECPLFVPVPEQALRLGAARPGEGNRSWSAGAGAGAMATGVAEIAWILAELRGRCPAAKPYLGWEDLVRASGDLFLWEAFVTKHAKGPTHVDDASVAVAAFRDALPDPGETSAVTAERPLSLLGAALIWSGWSADSDLLHAPCLVIRATPPAAAEAEDAARPGAVADPTAGPRANRYPPEVERKRQLLEEPHIAPLTEFVRRLRAERGVSVPDFDPTEAGTEARILLLFENPGRRADAAQGSGFISADNDDKSAENTWGFFRDAGIDRRRDIVAWNIVPWYLGDERRIGKVRAADIDEARPALREFLELLPNLRVVVLLGRKAQDGWRVADPPVDVPVLKAPHTSGRWLNAHPEGRTVIVEQLRKARELAIG
jgi:uracil-DNA glycosylase